MRNHTPRPPSEHKPVSKGYVYIVPGQPRGRSDVLYACKIGSTQHPDTRPRASSKSPVVMVLEAGYRHHAYDLEFAIHKYMDSNRVEGTREWFYLDLSDLDAIEMFAHRHSGAVAITRERSSVGISLLTYYAGLPGMSADDGDDDE